MLAGNLGPNIVDKFTKLSKIGFSMECFLQFSLVGQMSKFAKVCLLIGHLLAFNPKHVGIFLKSLISYHSPTREATRTFPDNNRWVVRNFSCPEQRQRCFVIKVFLEISENPPQKENTCARVFFLIKLQAWDHSVNLFTYKIYLWISKNSFFDETPLGWYTSSFDRTLLSCEGSAN